MLFQKGIVLLLLTRSVESFTVTPSSSYGLAFAPRQLSPSAVSGFQTALFSDAGEPEVTAVEEAAVVEAVSDVTAAVDEPAAETPAAAVEVPAAPEEEGFKVFIGNMSFGYGKEEIEALFTPFGTITDISVPTDKITGEPRGFAFITMADRVTGEAACEALNGSEVEGRNLRVNEQLPKEELDKLKKQRKTFKQPEGTKIYVGNLPFDTENDELSSMFEGYGTVTDCFIPTDRESGRPRGFAFVTMPEEGAAKAIDELNGTDFGGREMVVNRSLPRGESPPQSNKEKRIKLYVGNISFQTEEAELIDLFQEYGTIIDLYAPRDRETDRPRGFAFVTMPEDAAMNAINECDGFELDGRILRVNEAQAKGAGGGGGGYNSSGGGDGGYYESSGDDSWDDSY